MTFSQRAVEAATHAIDKLDHRKAKSTADLTRMMAEAALTAALAVDGVALQGELLRPVDEWTEDEGDVLWWYIKDGKVQEAPLVGSPLCLGQTVEAHTTTRLITQLNQEHDPEPVIHRIDVGGWPGYHTHWQPLPQPPAASEGEERK